jgi:hypothetical protein
MAAIAGSMPGEPTMAQTTRVSRLSGGCDHCLPPSRDIDRRASKRSFNACVLLLVGNDGSAPRLYGAFGQFLILEWPTNVVTRKRSRLAKTMSVVLSPIEPVAPRMAIERVELLLGMVSLTPE